MSGEGNVTVTLPEQIVCQEICANSANSNSDNEDPVFCLFLTKRFDPSDKSIEQIMALSEILGDEYFVSA